MTQMAGQNATFRGDEPTWANACVGENGDPQIYEYASGFASAANLLLDQVISNRGLTLYVDTFIYPICFNMRHAVELFLKSAATSLGRLAEIRGTATPKFDMAGSHDLGKIWAYVKEHALAFDQRYHATIGSLEPYVVDFASIDSTGQVFRYPFDIDNKKHLVALSIVNVIVLKKRWSELEKRLKDLASLGDGLLTEYRWGAFTANLSRVQLAEIAAAMPARAKWNTDAFDVAKTAMQQKFKLSNNEFSKALTIIQGRRELASLCEHVVPIPGVDAASLMRFFDIWLQLHDLDEILAEPETFDPIVDFDAVSLKDMLARHEIKKKAVQEMVENVTPETFAALHALYYFQQDEECSEAFERTLRFAHNVASHYEQSLAPYANDARHLLEKTRAMPDILNSLNYLGQTELVNAVVGHYQLEARRARLLEPSERARARICLGTVSD
ncbi:hypothetical protein J2W35_004142 [Variovorax boronicumulans]|uniref:hypothetical protein n=1 Tax=Variovorax boronicumulans TaxID=436515 RepID=UPI002784F8D1|nr:hypothetical protein [Variovorax boronicumulans]MDQ0083776.1 hypothetical protein [Variovorax boronicumulans]